MVIVPERQAVLDAANLLLQNKEAKALNYAVGYARELRDIIFRDDPDNAITIQCRYVLNNMQYWRGDAAKQVRSALKAWIDAP